MGASAFLRTYPARPPRRSAWHSPACTTGLPSRFYEPGLNEGTASMLDAVIRLSLRHRPVVLVLAVATLLYGTYVAATLPIDVFPDLDRPRVVLLTEAPGLAAAEVETLVTTPLETAVLGS